MRFQQRSDRRSALTGVVAGALLMVALLPGVGWLVVRFCPGGEHCAETGRNLYILGLVVSLAAAAAFGFGVRDIVEQRRNRLR